MMSPRFLSRDQVRKFMRTWFFPAGKEPIDLVASTPQPDMPLGSAIAKPGLTRI